MIKKGLEFINIARIVKDPHITSSLPTTSLKFPIPMVTYKLGFAFSANIINFNQFVNTLDLDAFLSNAEILQCNCDGSYQHHKHILTGDLHIIKNNILGKLFTKGLKCRESKPINFA